MRVLDLGALPGDVTLFGGVYSNLQALEALLRRAAGDTMVCAGDVVAYCADAEDCVMRMRDHEIACVAGNCELQLAAGAPDCGCGFEDGTACDRMSVQWYAHASAQVGAASRAWMAGLPDILCFRARGRGVAVIHGGVRDVARFIWSTDEQDVFQNELNALRDVLPVNFPLDLVCAAHSGLPFVRELGDVTWCNLGALGMPAHDGTRETSYARLTADGIALHRLAYDWRGAQRAMQDAGLVLGYEVALETGYWPSEDVLPEALRRSASG
ncbi:metallophosphoesterase family protein [Roseobacteraceae bacterium S113]